MRAYLKKLMAVNELFSRLIIVGCIGFMAYVVERCMDITEATGAGTYNIIQYSALFFGGELMMLIVKRVSQNVCDTKNQNMKQDITQCRDAD